MDRSLRPSTTCWTTRAWQRSCSTCSAWTGRRSTHSGVRRLASANGWRNLRILVRTDATTVVAYLNHQGGRRGRLHDKATAFLEWLWHRGLTVVARHLPGRLNELADALSRPLTRYGEHILRPRMFRRLLAWAGWLPSAVVDLFATASTRRTRRYIARTPDRRAEDVDALVCPWPPALLYAFPPIPLIPLVIDQSISRRTPRGTLLLVVPLWPGRPWFPALQRRAHRLTTWPASAVAGFPRWPWDLAVALL